MPILTTAFQVNAFQNNAFQIAGAQPAPVIGAGSFNSVINIDYGPTIGTIGAFFFSNTGAILSGTVQLGPGNSAVLASPIAAVSVVLPDVIAWSKTPRDAPQNFIQIRDIGGTAGTNNISVFGSGGGQLIDGLSSVKITSPWGFLRIAPNNQAPGATPTGWTIV